MGRVSIKREQLLLKKSLLSNQQGSQNNGNNDNILLYSHTWDQEQLKLYVNALIQFLICMYRELKGSSAMLVVDSVLCRTLKYSISLSEKVPI